VKDSRPITKESLEARIQGTYPGARILEVVEIFAGKIGWKPVQIFADGKTEILAEVLTVLATTGIESFNFKISFRGGARFPDFSVEELRDRSTPWVELQTAVAAKSALKYGAPAPEIQAEPWDARERECGVGPLEPEYQGLMKGETE
jgi:hypothetical protein